MVETRDRIVAECREIQPELAGAFGIQPAPPDAAGEDLVITGLHQLTAETVIDKHVAGLDAGRLELFDDLEDDLKRRMGFGLAVGNDLDPDDVAGLEEVLPTFHRVCGSGQFFDAPVKGGLDCRAVADAVLVHTRVSYFDDMARIKTRRGEFRE